MKQHEFRAMGTEWAMLCEHCDDAALTGAERLVREHEARLSRFHPDSALSKLNSSRSVHDGVLAEVLRAALTLREQTDGRFDPTLGARLSYLGYDQDFHRLNLPSVDLTEPFDQDLQVRISGDLVELEGTGEVDLGGMAKGWAVDRAVDYLAATGATNILVDGGGDIRVLGGEWPIAVGDKYSVMLKSGAIATSSTRRRRWTSAEGQNLHHILDPKTGLPSETNIDTVTVIADDAMTADALATAALVDLAGQLPKLLAAGIPAAVRGLDGSWYTTPNWSETP